MDHLGHMGLRVLWKEAHQYYHSIYTALYLAHFSEREGTPRLSLIMPTFEMRGVTRLAGARPFD